MEYENLPNVVMDRSTEEVALRNIVDDLMTWEDNSNNILMIAPSSSRFPHSACLKSGIFA